MTRFSEILGRGKLGPNSENMHVCWVRGACLAFASLLCFSMAVYPGGNAWNTRADGNDFWLNYLCDLARTVARNGQANPLGSALARAGMLALASAFAPFFWLLSLRVTSSPLRLLVRLLAGICLLGTTVTVLFPVDRYPAVHEPALLIGAASGLVACLVALLGDGGQVKTTVGFRLGIVTLLVSSVDFTLYARQLSLPGPGPVLGAVLERMAALLLIGWMWSTTVELDPIHAR